MTGWRRPGWLAATAVVILLLISPDQVRADTGNNGVTADEPGPLVITISYVPTPADLATTAVNHIDAATVASRPGATVTDLLQRAPGLHVEQTGGRGGVGSVYLRGSDPNYTLVLIDGIQVNDTTNSRGGSFDFSPWTRRISSVSRWRRVR